MTKLPKISAPLVIIALTLIFFWKILLTNLILTGVDVFLYFYPYKEYAAEAMRTGRLPLWNPHLFMGVPFLANSQTGLFYPPNWLFIWLSAPKQVAWSIGLHIAMAGIFMLVFAHLSLKLEWGGAMMAAILFAFGGYLGAQVEHVNQLNGAAWLPLIFLLYDLAIKRGWFWSFTLAVVVSITLFAGHAQTVFISLFGLGLYALWQGVFEAGRFSIWNIWRNIRLVAIISALAAALAAVQLLPMAELSALSIRSGGLTFREAVSFSLRPGWLHYSLLPPFSLDLSQIMGQAFGEWVAYLGVSGLLMAMLGMFLSIWKREARRFVFIAAAGLILSLGLYSGPLYLALYHFVPGFDLFRVPARWLLLYSFSMSILGGFAFNALLTPPTLLEYLTLARNWLAVRWWAVVLAVLPLALFLLLIMWHRPPLITLAIWLGLALITVGLIYFGVYLNLKPNYPATALMLLLLAELFWAAQTLNYNNPTAPQAYSSMRNPTAFLLSVADNSQPPDRFLSLSNIAYDPGDLHDLEQIYGDSLTPKALYNLIVATKEKEVLFFNLPLVYGLHSVDGYDGGILPLTKFVTLQKLFLPADNLSLDGRLREKLRFVPPERLLSMLNTRWIMTDKVFDAWINGIFYDLQFPARLAGGETIATTNIPTFLATDIGLVSHLEGVAELPDGNIVAEITVSFSNGITETLTVKAGTDTAEGNYPNNAAHSQATIGVSWPYGAKGVDYIAVYPLTEQGDIATISINVKLSTGQFVMRGLNLINSPTSTSRSIILSTEGDYRLAHSGNVKIYENRSALSRAFIVHQAEIVADDEQAIAIIKSSDFDPVKRLTKLQQGDESIGLVISGHSSTQDKAIITHYEPERVEINTSLNSPGWLLLTDTDYPGWQATVDGQPSEIIPANIMFRAVALPAGEHTVIFEFKPRSLQLGMLISGLAFVIVAIGLLATVKSR